MRNDAKARYGAAAPRGWKPVDGDVTTARGFLAAGVASGIKKEGLDLALVYSSAPSTSAAVFTLNHVKAAPVLVSQEHLARSRGKTRAVLLNSGCANACTGSRGMKVALDSARLTATLLNLKTDQVLVASTGVIGASLSMNLLKKGIPCAVRALSPKGGKDAVRAIMTTDTREKTAAVSGRWAGRSVGIGGMIKGAGMIHPRMATMLAVITTDAEVDRRTLARIFRSVIERTFNCLTVDGDTSTNDMVLLIANGASGVRIGRRSLKFFERGLQAVCAELARSVARDGEGATKFVEITVLGAHSFEEARRVARAVANSPLVKTALYGQELNWGRILAAAGNAGVPFDTEKVRLSIGGFPVFRNGCGLRKNQVQAEKSLRAKEVDIRLDLGMGRETARFWTCDLSHGYVDINGSYIS